MLTEFTVEPKLIAALPAFKLLFPLSKTVPKLMPLFVVLTEPLSVVVLAVLVNPLVKLKVPAFPKVTPFVLLKVVGVVMVFVPDPRRFTA